MKNEDQFLSEFEQAFYSDGYALASQITEGKFTPENLTGLVKGVYDYINIFLDDFIQKCNQEEAPLHCAKGCSWCCHQPVMALPYEAYYMYRFIKENFSAKKVDAITQRIKLKNQRTGALKVKELVHYKYPCPLLENSSCLAYDARPMGCRLFLSSSRKSCENDFLHSDNLRVYPLLYQLPLRLGRMLNEGVCSFLSGKGLFPTEWTFESHLILLFEKPGILNDWMEGKNNFSVRLLTKEDEDYLEKFETGSYF